MATYLELPQNVPANNETVWCRTQRWSGAPFLATWNAGQEKFTDTINGLTYPVYAISHWRSQ